mgnify:CR=1 FL=1
MSFSLSSNPAWHLTRPRRVGSGGGVEDLCGTAPSRSTAPRLAPSHTPPAPARAHTAGRGAVNHAKPRTHPRGNPRSCAQKSAAGQQGGARAARLLRPARSDRRHREVEAARRAQRGKRAGLYRPCRKWTPAAVNGCPHCHLWGRGRRPHCHLWGRGRRTAGFTPHVVRKVGVVPRLGVPAPPPGARRHAGRWCSAGAARRGGCGGGHAVLRVIDLRDYTLY